MDRYLALLIAHFIADFPLQAGIIYEWKTRSRLGLLIHTGIHLLIAFLLFKPPYSWWPALVALGAMHYFIDWAKLRWPIKPQLLGFILDQFWHALSLVLIAVLFPQMETRIPSEFLLQNFLVVLISPVLLMFWTYTFDFKARRPTGKVTAAVAWSKRNLLRFSQIVGFICAAIVLIQIF